MNDQFESNIIHICVARRTRSARPGDGSLGKLRNSARHGVPRTRPLLLRSFSASAGRTLILIILNLNLVRPVLIRGPLTHLDIVR